jgi:hypothetical protein
MAFAGCAASACGGATNTSLSTEAPPAVVRTAVVEELPARTDTPSPFEPNAAPVVEPPSIVIGDGLALRRVPESFASRGNAETFIGRFGERVSSQTFVSTVRHATVIVWLSEGRPAADILAEPKYFPSSRSVPGAPLFELRNLTSLTSNVFAWTTAANVVVGVTSREIGGDELFEWVRLVETGDS